MTYRGESSRTFVRNCPTHALAYEPVNASMDEKAASAARKLV